MGILKKKKWNKEAIIKSVNKKRGLIHVWWEITHTGEKIQIFLLLTNIIMVFAFIYFGEQQISRIDESLMWADSSNVSTKKSLMLAEETMELGNRAYVSVSNISPFSDSVYYDIVHRGNTPALNLVSYSLLVMGKNIDLSACRNYIQQFINQKKQKDETESLTIGESRKLWTHLMLYKNGPKSSINIVPYNISKMDVFPLIKGDYKFIF